MLIKPQNIGTIVNNFLSLPPQEQKYEMAQLERLLNEYIDALPIRFSNSSKQSIIQRIMNTILDGDFYVALKSNYNTVNLLDTPFDSYNNYLCAEPKLFLFSFKKRSAAYSLYLGLKNADLIVKTATIKKYNTTTNISVANYAYADHTKLKRAKDPFKNCLENSAELDRFDPIKTSEYEDHKNNLEFIANKEERSLYSNYFFPEPPCPHFHVFPVKLMATKPFSNKKSLAIDLSHLRQYVKDLDSTNNTNSPLLKYDLSMPYLMIKTNQIDVNIDQFFEQVKKLLDKYSKTNQKNEVVEGLYNLLYQAKEERRSVGAAKKTCLKDVYNALTIIEAATEYLSISDQIRLVNSYDDAIYFSNTFENSNYTNPEQFR